MTSNAQIKVYNNNSFKIGDPNSTLPNSEFQVVHDNYFQCLPLGGGGNTGGGIYIENFTNGYETGGAYNNTGSNTYLEPCLHGQFGNSVWLGTWNQPLWQVRTAEVWANNVLVTSDERLKKNIQPLTSSLESILLLNPVSYDLEAGITEDTPDYRKAQMIEAGKNSMGLLAQELNEVYPDLVRNNGNDQLAIDYTSLIPVLIKAIQEQQEEIDYLKKISEKN